MPVAGSGNFFQPTPDDGTQPQSQTLAMAQMMDPTGKAMQPDQTPEEHAQAKQGWLDWFKNPSTSAFLMQFGASMMQPNVRGFGAQLGQSLGEAGAAAGREREFEQKQQEQEATAEETRARAGYYEAETKAAPTLAAARQAQAEAAGTRAEAAASIAQTKADSATQLVWVQQQLAQARAEGDAARANQLQAAADQIQMKLKYPGLDQYQREHEAWRKAAADAQSAGLKIPDEPQPESYGVPRSVIGLPAMAPGQVGQTNLQSQIQGLKDYQDTPGFWEGIRSIQDPAILQEVGREYVFNRKQIPAEVWREHTKDMFGKKPATTATSPSTMPDTGSVAPAVRVTPGQVLPSKVPGFVTGQ